MQIKASEIKPGMLIDVSSIDKLEDIILITSVNYGVYLDYKCFVLADPDVGLVSGTMDNDNIVKVISGPEKTKIIQEIKNDQFNRQNDVQRDIEMLLLVEAMTEEPEMLYDDLKEKYECLDKQYLHLRKNFNEIVNNVLGIGYYNMGLDVYVCDSYTTQDIIRKFASFDHNKTFWEKIKNIC